jgi:hypothetical protein
MQFTDDDLKKAIEDKIFSSTNEVLVSPAAVIRYFENWASVKAKKMENALDDIRRWNDDLADEYDDPGIRAAIGLGMINKT